MSRLRKTRPEKSVTVNLEPAILEKIERIAVTDERDMAWVVRRLIEAANERGELELSAWSEEKTLGGR